VVECQALTGPVSARLLRLTSEELHLIQLSTSVLARALSLQRIPDSFIIETLRYTVSFIIPAVRIVFPFLVFYLISFFHLSLLFPFFMPFFLQEYVIKLTNMIVIMIMIQYNGEIDSSHITSSIYLFIFPIYIECSPV
jgi:hypothetical protein